MLKHSHLKALALCLAVLAAYLPALRAGFIWDDDDYVTKNPVLQGSQGLRDMWIPTKTPQYYPATFLSFWVEHRLWGLNPLGYHAVNVALHAVNALLLVFLLRRLPMKGAWLAGFLFALHPVAVESVAWVTERKNVLSTCFYLLAVGSFWHWEEGRGRRWYLVALGLFTLALLSKTVTASLPAVLVLARWFRKRPVTRGYLASLLPFLGLGLGLGKVTAWMEVHHVGAWGPEWELSFLQRSSLAGRALAFYAAKLAWPTTLCFNYARRVPDPGSIPGLLFLPALALLAFAGLWGSRDRLGRGPFLAAAFFAGTLLPALGFFNVYPFHFSFVADHFQYLASLGLLAAAGTVLMRAPRGLQAAVLLLLATLTFERALAFESQEALWRDTLRKNNASFLAHGHVGDILLSQGKLEPARRHLEAALAIKPDDRYAHNTLGTLLVCAGRTAEALPHLRVDYWEVASRRLARAIAAQGGHFPRAERELADLDLERAQAWLSARQRASSRARLERKLTAQPGREDLRQALEGSVLSPEEARLAATPQAEVEGWIRDAQKLGGELPEAERLLGYLAQDKDEAVRHFRAALRIQDDPEVRTALAELLRSRGIRAMMGKPPDLEGAYASYHEAMDLFPGSVDTAGVKSHLALVTEGLLRQRFEEAGRAFREGRLEEARKGFLGVLALDPDFFEARFNLGLVCGRLKDWPAAVEALEKACTLRPDDREAWLRLGDALAAVGKMEEAHKALERAEALAADSLTAP